MRTPNYFAQLIFFVILGTGLGIVLSSYGAETKTEGTLIKVAVFFAALIISCSIKITDLYAANHILFGCDIQARTRGASAD